MIKVHEAEEMDVPGLAEIIRLSPEAGHWTEDDIRRSIRARNSQLCLVAEESGQLRGLLLAARPLPEEAEILTVAVHPQARRRGVGAALLRDLIRRVPGRLFLEVRRSNQCARSLYERLGFVVYGQRPGYYHSPPEDAVLMQLTVNQ